MNQSKHCKLIAALLSRRDPGLLRAARVHVDKLIEHVDKCEVCCARLEEAERPEELYEILSGMGDLSGEDQAVMDRLAEAIASDERAVGRAVVEALLPALPERLSDSFRELPLNEVQLFSALDAIRMLVHDWSRVHGRAPDELASSGEVRYADDGAIPAATVVAAVSRLAEIPVESAGKVVAWIVEAARAMPALIPGVLSAPREGNSVAIRLMPYSTEDDLNRLWSPLRLPVKGQKLQESYVGQTIRGEHPNA